MRIIMSTNGFPIMVDDADYEWLNQYKWYAWKYGRNRKGYYAVRNAPGGGRIYMHREILGLQPGDPRIADHIDNNVENSGLINCRSNLRKVSRRQNVQNMRKPIGNWLGKPCSSPLKGASWIKDDHKWESYIRLDGRKKTLGRFDTDIEAHLAYCQAAKQYFGEYANEGY